MSKADVAGVQIHERAVLKKFDGDVSPEDADHTIPVEVVVAEAGRITEHHTTPDAIAEFLAKEQADAQEQQA